MPIFCTALLKIIECADIAMLFMRDAIIFYTNFENITVAILCMNSFCYALFRSIMFVVCTKQYMLIHMFVIFTVIYTRLSLQ